MRSPLLVVLACVLAVGLLVMACSKESKEAKTEKHQTATEQKTEVAKPKIETQAGKVEVSKGGEETSSSPSSRTHAKLPNLVDLGRNTCIPCKMMAPILEELKKEYEGRVIVEVIDLREDREAARKYRIRVIPTQILFDANGNEVWRHEGYIPKEKLEAKLAEVVVK